jgi:hypothetical protein
MGVSSRRGGSEARFGEGSGGNDWEACSCATLSQAPRREGGRQGRRDLRRTRGCAEAGGISLGRGS